MSAADRLEGEDLLWLLGSLCQIGRLPFDAALVAQEFPPPHSIVTLHEAARALGFKTGERRVDAAVVPGLTFPCIAFLRAAPVAEPAPATPTQLHVVREGEDAAELTETAPAEEPPLRPALLIRADDRQLLFFRAGSQQPETLPLAEFDLYFEPNLILLARDTSLSPAGRGDRKSVV